MKTKLVSAGVIVGVATSVWIAGQMSGFTKQPTPALVRVPAATQATRMPSSAPRTLAEAGAKTKGDSTDAASASFKLTKLDERTRVELADLASLSRKAFLSDDEKSRRQSHLRDSIFLQTVASILRSHDLDQETLREQYQAIDLLLESRSALKSGEAANLLRAIVADAQVEDATLPRAVRENLAGIKAEVLYEWAAREPDVAREIPENLPGPASAKIWENVQDQLARNVAESNAMERN